MIVLGDTIVDQYAACEAIGMSAEAPVVVVRELEHKNFIGGAAVVAAHISALGAKCDFVSVVGADDTAEIVRKELAIQGIGDGLSIDKSRPTTIQKTIRGGKPKIVSRQSAGRTQSGYRRRRSSDSTASKHGAKCSGDRRF